MTPAARMTTLTTGMASARESRGVFAASLMAGIAGVAMLINRRVRVEVVERLLAPYRKWSVVAVARIVSVVDMAIKSVRAVEPGASPDEHPTGKPVRPVVTIGCTFIGSIVEIAIGTNRWRSNADGYLRRCTGKTVQHGRSEGEKKNTSKFASNPPLTNRLDHRLTRKVARHSQKPCRALLVILCRVTIAEPIL
jgi:hypothetical protein